MSSGGGETRLVALLERGERAVYFGVAVALLLTVGMLFFSAAASLQHVVDRGALETSLTILDRVLLIFILVELLSTIQNMVQERGITVEPFLMIGLIAVVRRILLVTAEAEQTVGTGKFESLLLELGVLTALVLALSLALYVMRRAERPRPDPERP